MANLLEKYDLPVSQLPPSSSVKPLSFFPPYVAANVRLNSVLSTSILSDSTSSITLSPCGESDFQFWVLAPVLPGSSVAVFGELQKVVAISEQRFVSVKSVSNEFVFGIKGVDDEDINLWAYSTTDGAIHTTQCMFPSGEREFLVTADGSVKC